MHGNTTAHSAGLGTRLTALAMRAIGLTGNRKPSFGRVSDASQPLKSGGPQQMPDLSTDTLIHRRAVRVCNRSPLLVARYVRVQTILDRGRGYETHCPAVA